jgi:uncharacterized protein (TIGR00730 family)
MRQIKNITVFCASSTTLSPQYHKIAEQVGDFMAKEGFNLVFGGANVGLMKTIAHKVYNAGQKVYGIIPEFFVQRGLASECSTEITITKDMFDRKKLLIEKGDAFIALPGGFGTLDELIEVITLNQIGQINKPVIIYDPINFYDNLFLLFEKMLSENFTEKFHHSYHIAKSTNELKNILKN